MPIKREGSGIICHALQGTITSYYSYRQVISKSMRKTTILRAAQATVPIEVFLYDIVTGDLICLIAKEVTDMYPRCTFYVTIANFGRVYVHLPKHQETGEVEATTVQIIHIKQDRYSYLSDEHKRSNNSSVIAVYYIPAKDRSKK